MSADFSRIDIGGWECEITCEDCRGSLSADNLADLIVEAEQHLAEHGPKVEKLKRERAERREREVRERAAFAKRIGREPEDWEWRRERAVHAAANWREVILMDLPDNIKDMFGRPE